MKRNKKRKYLNKKTKKKGIKKDAAGRCLLILRRIGCEDIFQKSEVNVKLVN